MNRLITLITLTLVLCDVAIESPILAHRFPISERKLYWWAQIFHYQRPTVLPKALKRWWILVCIFPLNLASANTRKHWKEEDICCVNTDIDPTSITYGGGIKPPTLPRSWAPACVNLYSAGRPQLSCDGRSIAGVKKNHSESFKSTEI